MINIILKNGFVYTMNDKAPIAEAVAIEGQKIKAVGTTEEIMALKEVDKLPNSNPWNR